MQVLFVKIVFVFTSLLWHGDVVAASAAKNAPVALLRNVCRELKLCTKVTPVSVQVFGMPSAFMVLNLQEPPGQLMQQVPASWVPSGSIAPEDVQSIEGKVVTTAVRKGDILLRANLASQRHEAFSQKVRSGRRAITMPVDAINSVSGMLVPGDLIDLYVSFEYRRKRITAPLLQGVLVLATGSDSQPSGVGDESVQGTAFSTVTLDTAPEEAARLVAARQAGTITALLRHPSDVKASNKGVQGDLATLLGIAKPISVTRARAAVIYGNQPQHRLPALLSDPRPSMPELSRGLIELPETEDIVSAWINSLPGVRTSGSASSVEPIAANEDMPVAADDVRDIGATQVQTPAVPRD